MKSILGKVSSKNIFTCVKILLKNILKIQDTILKIVSCITLAKCRISTRLCLTVMQAMSVLYHPNVTVIVQTVWTRGSWVDVTATSIRINELNCTASDARRTSIWCVRRSNTATTNEQRYRKWRSGWSRWSTPITSRWLLARQDSNESRSDPGREK